MSHKVSIFMAHIGLFGCVAGTFQALGKQETSFNILPEEFQTPYFYDQFPNYHYGLTSPGFGHFNIYGYGFEGYPGYNPLTSGNFGQFGNGFGQYPLYPYNRHETNGGLTSANALRYAANFVKRYILKYL